jgi:hypothetical protein
MSSHSFEITLDVYPAIHRSRLIFAARQSFFIEAHYMASYVAYRAACVPLSEVEIFHNRIVNERLLMHFYYSTSECKIQILLM